MANKVANDGISLIVELNKLNKDDYLTKKVTGELYDIADSLSEIDKDIANVKSSVAQERYRWEQLAKEKEEEENKKTEEE